MSIELEEALKRMETHSLFSSDEFKKDLELIKSALERKEKLEKFCKLLKDLIYNKRFIFLQGIKDSKSYKEYKSWVFNLAGKDDLNETEFNILKEMLEEK